MDVGRIQLENYFLYFSMSFEAKLEPWTRTLTLMLVRNTNHSAIVAAITPIEIVRD